MFIRAQVTYVDRIVQLIYINNWPILSTDLNKQQKIKIWPMLTTDEVNRYKRGLETCPQAKMSKSGREYFLLFFSDASEPRVWLSAELKILASTLVQIRLYRSTSDYFNYWSPWTSCSYNWQAKLTNRLLTEKFKKFLSTLIKNTFLNHIFIQK